MSFLPKVIQIFKIDAHEKSHIKENVETFHTQFDVDVYLCTDGKNKRTRQKTELNTLSNLNKTQRVTWCDISAKQTNFFDLRK